MKPRPLLVIFFIVFVDLLGFGLIIPILPLFAQELGASEAVVGLVAASFSVMQFLFGPFWGGLSDRYGRKPVLMASMVLMGGSYLLFAQAHTLWWLFVSRLLAGIAAANISAAQAYISDISEPANRAKNFGIIGAAFGLGFIVGPPVGGFLKDHFGVEWVGYAAAAFSFLNLGLCAVLLRESLAVKNTSKALFSNPLKEIFSVLGRDTLRQMMVLNLVFITAFSMMQITSTLLWAGQYGLTGTQIGYLFLFIGVLAAVFQGFLVGPLNRRFGERTLLINGIVLMMIGLAMMPLPTPAYFIPVQLLALGLISLGNAFLTPTLSSLLSKVAPPGEQGLLMGTAQSFASLGRVLGPILGGLLYGLHPILPFEVSALLMASCIALALGLLAKPAIRAVMNPT